MRASTAVGTCAVVSLQSLSLWRESVQTPAILASAEQPVPPNSAVYGLHLPRALLRLCAQLSFLEYHLSLVSQGTIHPSAACSAQPCQRSS